MSDRALATVVGAVLFVLAAWPLAFLRMPPYQDLPDHLSTVCVLLNPARYPEYVTNGFLKANSLFVLSVYLLARAVGVVAAGWIFAVLVLATTAFTLPHFVLSFTDRKRLLVASLVMAPMVHNWWTLMGMLNFALAFPMGLLLLMVMARQRANPTPARWVGIALLSGVLWYAHGIVILLVALLGAIEALVQPGGWRAKLSAGVTILTPLVPVAALIGITVLKHALAVTGDHTYGHVGGIYFEDNFTLLYDLWAHWQFGISPLSAAGLVTAVALAVLALRDTRARVPFFSATSAAVLLALYVFLPNMMPGFGYVEERVIPFFWAWALVRVPARVPAWAAWVLLASSALWAAGTASDLFQANRDLAEFTAAAPDIPDASPARLLTLNFAARTSSGNNIWNLLHASGMYTVLRGAHPQDLWADSPSMPVRHAAQPSLVEDPVRIRQLLKAAPTPAAYCASLETAGFPDVDCETRFKAMWRDVWREIEARYDYVILWGEPAGFDEVIPRSFVVEKKEGRLILLRRAQ